MTTDFDADISGALLLLNPRSGSSSAELVRRAVAEHLNDCLLDIRELGEGDDLQRIIGEAFDRGVRIFVVAGGDGTVSSAANCLAGTNGQLAIFPMGTANVFARELDIPLDVDGACRLLAGRFRNRSYAVARIDAMRIAGHHYLTQVGVGIDSLMIRDTDDTDKRRFGRAAYLWSALTQIVGFRPRRFTIEIDGRTLKVRASEIVVANVGSMGQPPFRWGPNIRPEDGRLNVCIVRARSMLHFWNLFWHVLKGQHKQSPHVRYEIAEHFVSMATRHSLPVQADGEIIGETPVRIDLISAALQVIVPERRPMTASSAAETNPVPTDPRPE